MAKFSWSGHSRDGKNVKGVMEATSEGAVSAMLRRQGIMPGRIKQRGGGLIWRSRSLAWNRK